MRLAKFLTRAEAGELNRRLKRAGYKSTAERCYDYVQNIIRDVGGCDMYAQDNVRSIINKMGRDDEQAGVDEWMRGR